METTQCIVLYQCNPAVIGWKTYDEYDKGRYIETTYSYHNFVVQNSVCYTLEVGG